MVVRTRARLGSGGTLLKPKLTAGRMAVSGPASAPSQLTVAESMRCRSNGDPVVFPPAALGRARSAHAGDDSARNGVDRTQPARMHRQSPGDQPRHGAQPGAGPEPGADSAAARR